MAVNSAAARFQSSQFPSENGEKAQSKPRRNRDKRSSPDDARKGLENLSLSDSKSQTKSDQEEPEKSENEETCIICASAITYYALPPCNHRSCHICSLRLRSLYETKACPQCRVEADMTIFTKDAEKRYEDFSPKEITNINTSLGIKFTGTEIYDSTVEFLKLKCPAQKCKFVAADWDELKLHVNRQHQRTFCEICVENKKAFTHEHEIFTPKALALHAKFGENARGSVSVKSGFTGHPECGFCKIRFYGDDELFAHCRHHHERCHLCDRHCTNGRYQYYLNYQTLVEHFEKDHFPCTHQECLDKKFVVFESEMDLQSHELEAHPGSYSQSRPARDVRRVNLASFSDLRSSYTPVSRDNRRTRGGQGQQQQQQQQQQQSEQTRSQAPTQRTVYSANATGGVRTFGGQLTSNPEPSSVSPQPAPNTARDNPQSDTPADRARRARHEAILNRVRQLAKSDESKTQEFRRMVTDFRRGAITAEHFVSRLLDLFDATPPEIGILVRELSELFEIPDRRDALLRAWNDWRAINENFPVLGSNGSSTTNIISRSNWTSPSRTATPNRKPAVEQFPSLASATSQTRLKGKATVPSWSSTTASSASSSSRGANSMVKPTTSIARNGGSASTPNRPNNGISQSAFPALPVTKKPSAAPSAKGYSNSTFMQMSGGKSTTNAWGAGGSSQANSGSQSEGTESNSKRQGKKKQALIRFG